METYKYNGEGWYRDTRSIVKRVRRWFIWIGGLEKPNGKGWDLGRLRTTHAAYHDMSWWRLLLQFVTPVSIFGHVATLQTFGLSIRYGRAYLCIHWLDTLYGPARLRIYRSPDATPGSAYLWIKGAPRDVIEATDQRQREKDEEDRRWQARLAQFRAEGRAAAEAQRQAHREG